MQLYKLPPKISQREIEKRVREFKILRKMGLKTTECRCKLTSCAKTINIYDYVLGQIFCSDACMEESNLSLKKYYISLSLEIGSCHTHCKNCNYKYTVEDYLEDRDDYSMCSDKCRGYYKVDSMRDGYYENIKLGNRDNPRCVWCHTNIPPNLNLLTAVFCSEDCHDNYIESMVENSYSTYYNLCDGCGCDFETKIVDLYKCGICRTESNISFDFRIRDEVSSFWLGVFYNIANHEYDSIALYSFNRNMIELVKDRLGIDFDIKTSYHDFNGMYYVRIVGSTVNILQEYGLVANYIERDLPIIDDAMLPYFFSGLLYSSEVESDGIYKYYPMVSKDICLYLSSYLGLSFCYHGSRWCIYEEVKEYDTIDIDMFDMQYGDVLVEPVFERVNHNKLTYTDVEVIDNISRVGMRSVITLGNYKIIVGVSESSINGKKFNWYQSMIIQILFNYIDRAVYRADIINSIGIDITNDNFDKNISRLRKTLVDSGYEIVSVTGGPSTCFLLRRV